MVYTLRIRASASAVEAVRKVRVAYKAFHTVVCRQACGHAHLRERAVVGL